LKKKELESGEANGRRGELLHGSSGGTKEKTEKFRVQREGESYSVFEQDRKKRGKTKNLKYRKKKRPQVRQSLEHETRKWGHHLVLPREWKKSVGARESQRLDRGRFGSGSS